mmetsp:Transcript_30335/g.69795  ORF Transcript_30335/g.69795 Transcript_30335/m.69795 type:complete len:81 (-) Transcript_30335:949-1191(-)
MPSRLLPPCPPVGPPSRRSLDTSGFRWQEKRLNSDKRRKHLFSLPAGNAGRLVYRIEEGFEERVMVFCNDIPIPELPFMS